MEITVKPKELVATLQACSEAGLVPFVTSSPGIGKSDIFKSFAESNGRPFVTTHLSYSSPVDLRGFPIVTDEEYEIKAPPARKGLDTAPPAEVVKATRKNMTFAPPKEYPTEEGTVWLLDEYPCAPKVVQLASLQLLLQKRIGEWIAPKGTFIGAAGNRMIDKVQIERMSSANANRMCFISLVPDLDDWTDWALKNGVDTRVVAFLRWRPELLSNFDPKEWDGASGFCSPRSWASADKAIKAAPNGRIRSVLTTGLLGQGPSVELEGFLRIYEQLPDLDAILLNPSGAEVPDSPDARYAVTAALADKAEPGNFERVLTYAGRLAKEFEVFTVRLAVKSKPKLATTREFVNWASDNKSALLGE